MPCCVFGRNEFSQGSPPPLNGLGCHAARHMSIESMPQLKSCCGANDLYSVSMWKSERAIEGRYEPGKIRRGPRTSCTIQGLAVNVYTRHLVQTVTLPTGLCTALISRRTIARLRPIELLPSSKSSPLLSGQIARMVGLARHITGRAAGLFPQSFKEGREVGCTNHDTGLIRNPTGALLKQ